MQSRACHFALKNFLTVQIALLKAKWIFWIALFKAKWVCLMAWLSFWWDKVCLIRRYLSYLSFEYLFQYDILQLSIMEMDDDIYFWVYIFFMVCTYALIKATFQVIRFNKLVIKQCRLWVTSRWWILRFGARFYLRIKAWLRKRR
jgi:hypothetical protein